jgi:beta-lactamase regulating signal transducer with metallopeptidase domain
MRISSQLLLTFLLNACWQVALVAALASFSSRLLRNSAARYRHWIWVAALLLSIGIPLTTSTRIWSESFAGVAQTPLAYQDTIQPLVVGDTDATESRRSPLTESAIVLSRSVAVILLAIYVATLFYGALRLARAWYLTRQLRQASLELGENKKIAALIEKCTVSISGMPGSARICISQSVAVPITVGMFNPVIILPSQLLSEDNDEVLTSAIGHELVHVRRRDYALNFIYELLYLPLSFHPAAALIRRRIRQTRELSCDELVAERILNPEVYARSLVKLASSAPIHNRLSFMTTVGIADADILEARVMSLLKKPKLDTRRKRMLLLVISLLLLVPCLTAASFAMKFDFGPAQAELAGQEPSQQEQERKEKEKASTEMRLRSSSLYEDEFKERMKSDPKFREEIERKREIELKMLAIRQNALLNLARINMDQAIQIATSQQPGKVLHCSLDAEKWKEPGILDKDGHVFYRVVLVSSDDVETGGVTHVLVNAVDGSVLRTEKSLPRKQRKPE